MRLYRCSVRCAGRQSALPGRSTSRHRRHGICLCLVDAGLPSRQLRHAAPGTEDQPRRLLHPSENAVLQGRLTFATLPGIRSATSSLPATSAAQGNCWNAVARVCVTHCVKCAQTRGRLCQRIPIAIEGSGSPSGSSGSQRGRFSSHDGMPIAKVSTGRRLVS